MSLMVVPISYLDSVGKRGCDRAGLESGIIASAYLLSNREKPIARLNLVPARTALVSRLQCDMQHGIEFSLGEAPAAPSRARVVQADFGISYYSTQGPAQYVDCFLRSQAAHQPLGTARPAYTKSWPSFDIPEEPFALDEGEARARFWFDDKGNPQATALSVAGDTQTLVIRFGSNGEAKKARVVSQRLESVRNPDQIFDNSTGYPAVMDPQATGVIFEECRTLSQALTGWLAEASEGRTVGGVSMSVAPTPLVPDFHRREAIEEKQAVLREALAPQMQAREQAKQRALWEARAPERAAREQRQKERAAREAAQVAEIEAKLRQEEEKRALLATLIRLRQTVKGATPLSHSLPKWAVLLREEKEGAAQQAREALRQRRRECHREYRANCSQPRQERAYTYDCGRDYAGIASVPGRNLHRSISLAVDAACHQVDEIFIQRAPSTSLRNLIGLD